MPILKSYYEHLSLCAYMVIRSAGSGVRPSSNASFSTYSVTLDKLLILSVLQFFSSVKCVITYLPYSVAVRV